MQIKLVKLLLAGSLGCLVFCCQTWQGPFIEAYTGADVSEVRLGESDYYLRLPDDFQISEARGKEGQLGYNLIPKDASSTMFGLIEIKAGNPTKGGFTFPAPSSGSVRSNLLDRQVTWTINQTETGYFNAYTTEAGDLNARVSSKNRDEVDRLISIVATLRMSK